MVCEVVCEVVWFRVRHRGVRRKLHQFCQHGRARGHCKELQYLSALTNTYSRKMHLSAQHRLRDRYGDECERSNVHEHGPLRNVLK